MFGGSAFVPEPMIWPGISPPSPEYGRSFYNPGRTETGRERLRGFISVFSDIFNFIAEEERAGIIDQIETLRIPEPERFYDNENYGGFLSGSGESLLEDLMAAYDFKQNYDEAFNTLGKDLENWNDYLGGGGAYDSQILFPLITACDNREIVVPDEIVSEISGFIDNMDEAAL